MNKQIYSIITIAAMLACTSPRSMQATGDSRTISLAFIDDNTYLLVEQANDKSYGLTAGNPVKVGGLKEGPKNERRFLNALLGPNGQEVRYYRAGSCCPFETPNGLINNVGMLDRYRVSWVGSRDTVDIYINMYDAGDLKIPVGFTAKKPN